MWLPGCSSCLAGDRRRHVERLWRRQLLVTNDERRARRRFARLMRGFDVEDLEVLKRAVETSGRDIKACAPGPPMDLVDQALPGCSKDETHTGPVTVINLDALDQSRPLARFDDSGLIPQIDRPMSMPYLCCKMWRWKDLQVDAALHRLDPLPWCRFGRVTLNNATVSCCNPYHYALWIRPELCSASEESTPIGLLNGSVPIGQLLGATVEDTGFGEEMSMSKPPPHAPPPPPHADVPAIVETTPDEEMANASPTPITVVQQAPAWGRMARWEGRERVGDIVSLTGQFIAVGFLSGTVHDGQNVAIDWDKLHGVSFALIRHLEPDQSYEDVWLYNSGDKPLFTCAGSASGIARGPDTIRRLSPGYCIRVHRFGPLPNSPRIPPIVSFLTISHGKGWGPNYHRLYITDTPCRFEIAFS